MPDSERAARALYVTLLYAAAPILLPYFLWRGVRTGKYLSLLPERLGWRAPAEGPPGGGLWVHAVSAGEVLAARTLVPALAAATGFPVVLTATTTTGVALARAAASAGEVAAALPSPLDFPGAVRHAFDRIRPRALVLLEAEIWPSLLAEAARRGVPVVLANTRLSERSRRGYARFPALFRPLFAGLAAVGARSAADAERALALGAHPDRVSVTGDLKFDAPPPLRDRAGERAWLRLPEDGLALVAGSVLAGEEGAVFDAFRVLRTAVPGSILVYAPRQSFATPPAATGLAVERRTECSPVAPGGVLLLDTMGELKDAYAAGDIAFVGGSLVPKGGHNLLEPAAAGLPILVGPHSENFAEAAERLIGAGGAERVIDAAALAAAVVRLGLDAVERETRGQRARAAVEEGRGAVGRTVGLVESALASSSGGH